MDFYMQLISTVIDSLAHQLSENLQHSPLVISGMAGSSIGLKELPYASLFYFLDGTQANIDFVEAQQNFPNDFLLVSGVQVNKMLCEGKKISL